MVKLLCSWGVFSLLLPFGTVFLLLCSAFLWMTSFVGTCA